MYLCCCKAEDENDKVEDKGRPFTAAPGKTEAKKKPESKRPKTAPAADGKGEEVKVIFIIL